MTDTLLVLVGVLLAATIGAAAEYYRQIRRLQKEYEKAKEAVEDIVLSFNRQLKREAEKLEVVAYKVEGLSSKGDRALKMVEGVEKELYALKPRIRLMLQDRESILVKLDETDKKMRDTITSQMKLAAKISGLQKEARQFTTAPESRIEAVIPIRREKALAPLTDTELSVLEILAQEGPKTAPDIKDAIKLSREHTARLMKKLYETGYLDRNTSRIPFKYRVKKEMEKLLKKTESET